MEMVRQQASPILSFYADGPDCGVDHRGRTRKHILGQDDAWLEQRHDFIQWLFPLPEPSPYNPSAPTLRAEDIAAFRADPALRQALRRSLLRMLAFYGFDVTTDPQGHCAIKAGARLSAGAAHWIAPHDHNFLRISRILRSLHLLGCPEHAAAFLAALETLARSNAGRSIGAVTLSHWRAAARGMRLA